MTRSPASPTPDPAPDIRTRIENALAVLTAFAAGQGGAVRRQIELATTTLRAAAAAVHEAEQLLEISTDVDLDAARELQRLQRELEQAREREQGQLMRVADLEARLEAETEIHGQDRDRLQALERKSRGIDEILATDPAAFDAFMKKALDKDERVGPGNRRRKR